MEKINNRKLLKRYLEKFKIDELFSTPMMEHMELFKYSKGEYICREEEGLDYLLFLVKGKAKVYISLKNGKFILLCFYYPFMVIGDLELVEEKAATSNTQAIDDTYCIAIKISKVRELLLKDAKFMRYVCGSLGNKLERASKNGAINMLYPLENRLASYIMATRVKDTDNQFVFEGNLMEISELLGTSYRHLLRTLNRLVNDRILEKNEGKYAIKDKESLKKLAADIYK